MVNNGYLTTAEAATYLKLSKAAIWKWAKEGLIGSKMKSRWRFTRAELDRFVRGEGDETTES